MPGTSTGIRKGWEKRKRARVSEQTVSMEKGMTLVDVSKKSGVPVKTIIEYNGFTSPDQIKAGLVVKLPVKQT